MILREPKYGASTAPADHGSSRQGTGLIIFDFDGVVVDSEPISLATLHAALADFGVTLTPDDVRATFLGGSMRQIEQFVDAHGTRTAAEGFAELWNATLFARFRRELQRMPGIDALLDHLDSRSLPYCIASGASFERLNVALEAVGFLDRFAARVFSVDLVAQGKPAPDIFLRAAADLRQPADRCLVIEDSPAGIAGAKAAGMRALGFIGGSHLADCDVEHVARLRDARADAVIATLEEAIDFL